MRQTWQKVREERDMEEGKGRRKHRRRWRHGKREGKEGEGGDMEE